MTEEDTIRYLTRPTFPEMKKIMDRFHKSDEYLNRAKDRNPEIASKIILEAHGWKFDEYIIALYGKMI